MDWHKRTEETHTTTTEDGAFVVTLSRVTHKHAGTGAPAERQVITPWRGRMSRVDTGAVVMEAEDTSYARVVTACKEWHLAFTLTRERNPTTDEYPKHPDSARV